MANSCVEGLQQQDSLIKLVDGWKALSLLSIGPKTYYHVPKFLYTWR
jgi:hypothetical protein